MYFSSNQIRDPIVPKVKSNGCLDVTVHTMNRKMKRFLNKFKNGRKLKTKSMHISPRRPRHYATILWRPSLSTIWNDTFLFDALIKFTERSFSSENILFLQSVENLKRSNADNIDANILSIYDLYIQYGAQYQVNLSYACFMHVMSKRGAFKTLDMNQKYSIFDVCVDEIERLVVTSILSAFYSSSFFHRILPLAIHKST
eukprot:123133_1